MDWARRFGSTRLLDVLLFDPNKVCVVLCRCLFRAMYISPYFYSVADLRLDRFLQRVHPAHVVSITSCCALSSIVACSCFGLPKVS